MRMAERAYSLGAG